MNAVAIQTFLALIEGILPALGMGSGSIIEKILASLEALVPIIAANFANFLTPVKNIIAALQSSGNVSADQQASLKLLDAACDAAFDAAAAAAVPPTPAVP